MHLLILAYHFTSQNSVGNLRIQKFANSFQNLGYQVTLFSAVSSELAHDYPFRVIQFPISDFTLFFDRKPSSRSQESGNFWLKAILRLKNTFPFLYLLSPGGPQYRCAIQKAFKTLHTDQPVTHLLTSYDPVYDLIIGHDLKRKAPELHWIVDFRDLPVDPVKKNAYFPTLTNLFYRKLIRGADKITTVSQGLAQHLPFRIKLIDVIYNGFDPKTVNHRPNLVSSKFTLTYTGTVHAKIQDPTPLFQALTVLFHRKQINPMDIELHIAGPQSIIWRNWLKNYPFICLIDHGYLSTKEAIKLQQVSQINLLLTWSKNWSSGILTTKLFEYLAARRPILGLVNGKEDIELNKFIQSVNGGVCIYSSEPNKENKLTDWLFVQYNSWAKYKFIPSENKIPAISQYQWDQLFSKWHLK
ncbi:MAG: hypothetical protein R2806_12450 [Saprospiraceae bacterium]